MTRSPERFILHGKVYVSLRGIAACYDVELQWVEEVYRIGLLGPGEEVDQHVAVAAVQLDRVARIVRLHFHCGVHLSGIPGLLEPAPEPEP